MAKSQHCFTDSKSSLSIPELETYGMGWLLDSEVRQLSPNTIDARRRELDKLLWYLKQQELATCGTMELRRFLAYLTNGHQQPGGRWGNPRMTKPVRPRTVSRYYIDLKTFFGWVVEDGGLDVSPMETISPPVVRKDQIQPFTPDQVAALIAAAKRSTHPRRNEAILLLLLDTGLRASELCNLKMKDLDMQSRRLTVLGKGNKHRAVFFGADTTKALWKYLKEQVRQQDSPLFTGDRGRKAEGALTRNGLLELFYRLGKAARIEATRCSPHTCRHTFAIEFLRDGGNVFSLQQLLGHTSLHQTNLYLALAQADLQNQHRQHSPVDRMNARRK